MENLYLIIGIYWVIAAVSEFLNHGTIFKDVYKGFKDYKMPLYAAFWFLLVVGFILFVPFTFPKALWVGTKNNIKFRRQINKQRREKKELEAARKDPMLMAKRILDNLSKYSSESVVWPVITVEGNKSEIWNELNTINEYVFMYIAREKAQIQQLKTENTNLKAMVSARDETIEKYNNTHKEPISLPPVKNNIKNEPPEEKPLEYFFDARTCNLIKKYEQTYGGKFVRIKDLAKMSHHNLKMLRGVGKDTLKLIENKVQHCKIPMKD